jgi:hypothetical protein
MRRIEELFYKYYYSIVNYTCVIAMFGTFMFEQSLTERLLSFILIQLLSINSSLGVHFMRTEKK